MSDLRGMENESIRQFVSSASQYFVGDVLDYGSGTRPYQDIVEKAGATYHPYDRLEFPASRATEDVGFGMFNKLWDAILCT